MISEFAPAKVNLTLNVMGRRPDGYHVLESLVVFPDIGDQLTFENDSDVSLDVTGPGADGLAGEDNLVLRAAKALRETFQVTRGAHIVLEKRLPVASGIGGGSADAAAALRGLCALWSLVPDVAVLQAIALKLGADVPVCLLGKSAMMTGIGDSVEPVEGLPGFHMVLVNCRKPVSTAAVFEALNVSGNVSGEVSGSVSKMRSEPLPGVKSGCSFSELIEDLAATHNDLQTAALLLEPEIGTCLEDLSICDGAALARMSGSGATCFALFEGQLEAEAASAQISARHPDWWVRAAAVN